MEVIFECNYCDHEITADTQEPNGRIECPGCHEIVLIPAGGINPGMKLGDFRIERCLGVGGMGEVFLATQVAMDRPVALKVLPPAVTGNKALVERFLQEARMAGRLEHPNVVTAFYAGTDAGYHYIAMSYVNGIDIDTRIKHQGKFRERDALQIVRQVAVALDYAWDKHQLLHRDIKPANIMLTPEGDVKLMDMGIAKVINEESNLTVAGVMLGTPFYMSPEQAKNVDQLDCRTDIYALGATLFHMITGRRPFDGPTAISVVAKHLNEPVPMPHMICPDVSSECGKLVSGMMAKEPAQRPQNWIALIAEIDKVLNKDNPNTLPTSLITILAFNFPKVIICATLSLYFLVKYSNTRSLFSSQKSISKSGIDILSGFKNLSKIRLNFIGSTSVIDKHQATKEPAPEPLPGPTGISFFFAHLI